MEQEGEEECCENPMVSYRTPVTVPVCRCLLSAAPSEVLEPSERKKAIYTRVCRTERYLRERRVPELMRYLLCKMLAAAPTDPVAYLEQLFDDMMLYRAGLGMPPILYERRHMEAVVKSFDPGSRGWVSAGQVRRVLATLGLPAAEPLAERTPADHLVDELMRVQERELRALITAGCATCDTPSQYSFFSDKS